jgi:hypothetical protein
MFLFFDGVETPHAKGQAKNLDTELSISLNPIRAIGVG